MTFHQNGHCKVDHWNLLGGRDGVTSEGKAGRIEWGGQMGNILRLLKDKLRQIKNCDFFFEQKSI